MGVCDRSSDFLALKLGVILLESGLIFLTLCFRVLLGEGFEGGVLKISFGGGEKLEAVMARQEAG